MRRTRLSAENDTKRRRLERMIREATSETEWQTLATGERVRRIDVKSLLKPDPLRTVTKVACRVAQDYGVWIPRCVAVATGGCRFIEALGLRDYTIALKNGRILCAPPEASRVLLLEDITTTGASAYRAAQACQRLDLAPVACLTLIDRGLGARELLGSIGCILVPVVTVTG